VADERPAHTPDGIASKFTGYWSDEVALYFPGSELENSVVELPNQNISFLETNAVFVVQTVLIMQICPFAVQVEPVYFSNPSSNSSNVSSVFNKIALIFLFNFKMLKDINIFLKTQHYKQHKFAKTFSLFCSMGS
jgi:hypothetical protein